ncbi:MAG: hypothetical protein MK010_11445 [Erythrobacter sp.]|nr:hypothetical protein [Erythrobacter sp.]
MLFRALDRLLTRAPDPARVAWIGQWTYAHCGFHKPGVPENSLAAFAGAIVAGYGIECDIQRSRDGEAMLLHDWELERLTGMTGPIAAHSAEELAQIAYLDSEHKIARLSDLLELVAGQVPVLIEIKSHARYNVAKTCRAVRTALEGYPGPYAVMSFDPRVARWFRAHTPRTRVGLVVKETADGSTPHSWQRHLAFWTARPDFVAYDIRALPNRFASDLRARGFPLPSWTVDTPHKFERAMEHADAPIAEGNGFPTAEPHERAA